MGTHLYFQLTDGESKAKEAKGTPFLMFPSPSNQVITSPAGGSESASNGHECQGQQLN